jgi:hypothetical protein
MEGLFSLRRRASRRGPRGQPPVTPDKNSGNGNGNGNGGHSSNRENEGNGSNNNGTRRRMSSTSSLIPPPFDMTDLGSRENREVSLFSRPWLQVRNLPCLFSAHSHRHPLVSQCPLPNAISLGKMFCIALPARAHSFLECSWWWSWRSELRPS